METIPIQTYDSFVIFTGAGISAESGIPIYRGPGEIVPKLFDK